MRVSISWMMLAGAARCLLADDLPPAQIPNLASVLTQTVKYSFANTCIQPSSAASLSCGSQSGPALLQLLSTPGTVIDAFGDLIIDGSNPAYTNGPDVQPGIWAVAPDGTTYQVSDTISSSCRMTSSSTGVVTTVAVTSFHWNPVAVSTLSSSITGALFMTVGNYEDDYNFTKSNPTFCQTFSYSSGDYSLTERRTLALVQVDYPPYPGNIAPAMAAHSTQTKLPGVLLKNRNRRPLLVRQ